MIPILLEPKRPLLRCASQMKPTCCTAAHLPLSRSSSMQCDEALRATTPADTDFRLIK